MPKMRQSTMIYYQVDIYDTGTSDINGLSTYKHAEVLIFEHVDLEELSWSIDPILTANAQSSKNENESPFQAFKPVTVRHCCNIENHCVWYGMKFKCSSLSDYDHKKLNRAASILKRIKNATIKWRDENPEEPYDELKQLIMSLRRMRAKPVKYIEHGYEVVQ